MCPCFSETLVINSSTDDVLETSHCIASAGNPKSASFCAVRRAYLYRKVLLLHPILQKLPDGLDIIICSVVCTVIVALLFPHVPEEFRDKQETDEKVSDLHSDDKGGIQ